MERRNWERLAGLAGIVLVGFIVAGVLATGSPPSPSDSNEAFKAYLLDKQDALILQGWLLCAGAMLMLWWAAAVRGVLRRAEGSDGHLANVFYGGVIVSAGLIAVLSAVQVGLAYKAAPDVDAAVVRALMDVCLLVPLFFGFFLAIGALAFAAVTLTEALFPAWSAWIAVLAAAGNLVVTVTIFREDGAFSAEGAFGFVGFGLTMLWFLSTSIVMLRAQDAAA